jgi:hypothetical protein
MKTPGSLRLVSLFACASACSSSGGDPSLITLTGTLADPGTIQKVQMGSFQNGSAVPCESADLSSVDGQGRFTLQVKKGCTYDFETVNVPGGFGPSIHFCSNYPFGKVLPVAADAPGSFDFGVIAGCENQLWPSRSLVGPDCQPLLPPTSCNLGDAGANVGNNRSPILQPISGVAQYTYDADGNYMGGTLLLSTSASDPDGDTVSIAWSVTAATGSARLASSTGTSNMLVVDSFASGTVTALASDGNGGSTSERYDFARPN